MAHLKKLIVALVASVLAHFVILSPVWEPRVVEGGGRGAGHQALQVKIKSATSTTAANAGTNLEPAVPSTKDMRGGGALPSYVASGELTEQPSLLDELAEIATGPVASGGLAKTIVLRLIIGTEGNVIYLQVLETTLPKTVEEQVVRAFYEARYTPGRVGPRAVTAEMLVSISID